MLLRPRRHTLSSRRSLYLCGGVALLLTSQLIQASPWIETDDAFLRADVQLLADAGLIQASLNTYPLRWNQIGDELEKIAPEGLTETEQLAYYHVRYTLKSRQLQRGNRQTRFVAGNRFPDNTGFGQFSRDEWGLYGSYSHMQANYAFRVNTNYVKQRDGDDDETAFNWDGSFVAFSVDDWYLVVGAVDRWWGPGWQNSLVWDSKSRPVPAVSVSYAGVDTPILKSWSIETLVGKQNSKQIGKQNSSTGSDYLWASRLSSKPLSFLSVGASYQVWWGQDGKNLSDLPDVLFNKSDSDVAITSVDAHVQLPKISFPALAFTKTAQISHGAYVQYTTSDQEGKPDAAMFGWSGQTAIHRQVVRLIWEHQNITGYESTDVQNAPDYANQSSVEQSYPGNNNGQFSASYELKNSDVIRTLIQFSNDHALNLGVYWGEDWDSDSRTVSSLEYIFPIASSRIHLGYSNDNSHQGNDNNFWLGMDYRF
ncbi:capsule assembly Wzi family protein [Photobacterium sagamiensis]|uniref:capsule assembly Wzi family protein n=1 Tax=Photobacterium sagamiensis TaxID=2910241 RepID=UPI003D0E0EDC